MQLVPYALAAGLVYALLFPILVTLLMSYSTDEIRGDQLMRAQEIGTSKESNPFWHIRKRYSKLYYQFKPKYYYVSLEGSEIKPY